MANNKDVELAKINASRSNVQATLGFFGLFVRVAGWVVSIKFIMDGLEQIVVNKPESISALAKLVEALDVGTIAAYLLAGGAVVAWKRERVGKKLAIRKVAEMRREYEPNESSSGLTETGDTPDEE